MNISPNPSQFDVKTDPVYEKVLRILELLSAHPGITQRSLSEKAGMSLGLVNVILKRLGQTGAIKIHQLTGRRVRYMLTPKGFSEKAQRTYVYFSRTFKVFRRQQERCERMITELAQAGAKHFALLGTNEIASLVELALRNSPHLHFRRIDNPADVQPNEMILDCRFDGQAFESLGTSVLSRILRQVPLEGVPAEVFEVTP